MSCSPILLQLKTGLFRRQWLPCTARFKTLKGAFWLFGDLIVGLGEVILCSFPLVMWGKGGNASAVEGRELFQLKSLLRCFPHTPQPWPPTAFPSLTYGKNSSKGTVSCFCLTWRYNFQEYSREMMRNRLRQPYTCQDMQEFREFCPFASTQEKKVRSDLQRALTILLL